jgi:hypothetical protein
LAERNTTARAPLHSADAQHRDYNLRNDEQRSYDDTVRRPKAIGRCAGPGCAGALKPAQTKVASIERQMVEILRKKCDNLEKDLLHSSKLQGKLQKSGSLSLLSQKQALIVVKTTQTTTIKIVRRERKWK